MKKFLLSALMVLFLYGCSSCAPASMYVRGQDFGKTQEAVYRIEVQDKDGDEVAMGTGWAAEIVGKTVFIVTAGHVCNEDDEQSYIVNIAGEEEKEPAEVLWYRDDGDDGGWDICIMKTHLLPKALIALAPGTSLDLEVGQRVWLMGFPQDVFSILEGRVTSRTEDDQVRISMPSYPGASGSAVMDMSGRCVGVLVRVSRMFHHITIIVPVEQVREALRKAHEEYGK